MAGNSIVIDVLEGIFTQVLEIETTILKRSVSDNTLKKGSKKHLLLKV